MDSVRLAIIDLEASLADALDTMASTGKSAMLAMPTGSVLAPDLAGHRFRGAVLGGTASRSRGAAGGAFVVEADDLIAGIREFGPAPVRAIAERVQPKTALPAGWRDPAQGPFGAAVNLEWRLESTVTIYAVGGQLDPGFALVVTRSERYRPLLTAALTVCRCSREPRHVFRASELQVPGQCNYDGQLVNCF